MQNTNQSGDWREACVPGVDDPAACTCGGMTGQCDGCPACVNLGCPGFEHDRDDEPSDLCRAHGGRHEWSYSGTAYGGDDESYFGEGRCICVHCGADGDA